MAKTTRKYEVTTRKYEVTIKNVEGTCDSPLFKKMAERGDITSTSVKDLVGSTVNVNGYADCHITIDDKDFDVLYIDTNQGLIHTGSTVFVDGFKSYYPDSDVFRIEKIKTKKGVAYKCVPSLSGTNDLVNDSDDLPFN